MIKKEFTTVVDGQEIKLCVVRPTANDRKESQKIYNTAFTDALKSGAVVRAKLDDIMEEQGLWDAEKQMRFDTIQREITDCEAQLEKGGIPLSAAKQVALKMRKLRAEFRDIISDKTALDTHSAEGQADNERFNYFVYACTFKEDGKTRYFKSYKEFMEAGDDVVSAVAASELANLLYGLDDNYEASLPENKFLKEYKFVDENLRFINKDGKYTDVDGRLVDELGRYIDEQGNYIDKFGNPLDAEGNLKVEFKPFTDDDGNPIINETEAVSEKPKKNSKKTSKKETEEVST